MGSFPEMYNNPFILQSNLYNLSGPVKSGHPVFSGHSLS